MTFILRRMNINIIQLLKEEISKRRESTPIKRDSGFEILRILCIISIIMQHFAFWGDFDITGPITFNTVVLQTIVNAGKIGVNCFMLITGYFMVNSTFKVKKLVKLMIETWVYSWGFLLIYLLINPCMVDMENFINSTIPIISGQYWFVTIYILVYLFSPMLNGAANAVSKNTFKNILVMLLIMWSAAPALIGGVMGWNFTNTGWMILMYLTGAYIRKHYNVTSNNKYKWLLISAGSYVLLMIATVLYDVYVERIVYPQVLAKNTQFLL